MLDRSEGLLIPSKDILQAKTNALITSFEEAIHEGTLNPLLIRSLHTDSRRTNADILAVYLGLKPAATYLHIEVENNNPKFYSAGHSLTDYLEAFPLPTQGGSPLGYVPSGDFYHAGDVLGVWNEDAVMTVTQTHPDAFQEPVDPSDWEFGFTLKYLTEEFLSPEEELRFALLLGIPRTDAEEHIAHEKEIENLCEQLGNNTKIADQLFNKRSRFSFIRQLMFNERKTRDKVLAYIDQNGLLFDPQLVSYLSQARPVKVPGFQYITTGPFSDDEKRMRKAWKNSQIEPRIQELLTSHGV